MSETDTGMPAMLVECLDGLFNTIKQLKRDIEAHRNEIENFKGGMRRLFERVDKLEGENKHFQGHIQAHANQIADLFDLSKRTNDDAQRTRTRLDVAHSRIDKIDEKQDKKCSCNKENDGGEFLAVFDMRERYFEIERIWDAFNETGLIDSGSPMGQIGEVLRKKFE